MKLFYLSLVDMWKRPEKTLLYYLLPSPVLVRMSMLLVPITGLLSILKFFGLYSG